MAVLQAAFLDAARLAPHSACARVREGCGAAVRALGARAPLQGRPLLSPEVAASRRLAQGSPRSALAMLDGVSPLVASAHLGDKGFVPTGTHTAAPPVPPVPVDPFQAAEVEVAVGNLKAHGAGPDGLRPSLLGLAISSGGAAVKAAVAQVMTHLLQERPPWLFRTLPMVLRKPSGGVRVIELAEALAQLLEILVTKRCSPPKVQDAAIMAIIARARIQRREPIVVADVHDGFNAVPHRVLLEWAGAHPELSMLVSAQLSHRSLVDERGATWTRGCGGPTGARTTCAAFSSELARRLPPGALSYVDDIVCRLEDWGAVQRAVHDMGLTFAPDKVVGFNLPDGCGIRPAPQGFHLLGAPVDGVSKRVTKLRGSLAKTDVHDALTLAVSSHCARMHFDFCVGNAETDAAIVELVGETAARAGLSFQDLQLSPQLTGDACVLATLVRMLLGDYPYAWELFHEGNGWFSRAKAIFVDRGFSVGADGRSIVSPQGTTVSEVPARYLSKLANASRKARNARALEERRCAPDSNVITGLLLASGERPHLDDQMVATATALRTDDQQALRDVARSALCPLCGDDIGPHHPLSCSTICARGMSHDKLVSQLASHVAKNPSLSVRANKGHFKPRTRETDSSFRPDIAIEETNQLFEVKTANADAHGPSINTTLARYAREAHAKYMRKVQRAPLVIATTTDGFVSKQGFMALDALTHTAYQDMPVAGPRLMLIAGFALCEAAAGAYDAWHFMVRSMQPVPVGAGGAGA